jgi:hypothetical protein
MLWLHPPREARRAMRVHSHGSIWIRHGAHLIRARIVDLSAGGMCVRAELPLGFGALVDELVRVEVELDARPANHFTLLGRVLRASAATRMIVLAFERLPDGFEDRVQDELLAAVEGHEPLT